MKRLIWQIFACVLAAVPAFAETVTVQSGEHDRFTRLVLPISQGARWTLESSASGYELVLAQDEVEFDISKVFQRIPRTRISTLSADGAKLSIELACECLANAYTFNERFLVIDVTEGEKAETSKPNTDGAEFQFGELLWSRNQVLPSVEKPDDDEKPNETETTIAVATDTFQDRILRDIALAATEGLLTSERPMEVTVVEPEDEPPEIITVPEPQVERSNLIVRNSIDIPDRVADQMQSATTLVCPNPGTWEVSSWGTPGQFPQQIAALRGTLSQELDVEDKSVAKRLAQTFVYFGFGQEALQTVKVFNLDDEHILKDMAHILEHGRAMAGSQLSNMVECDNDISLWAALADDQISEAGLKNRNSIIRGLEALPPHLREYLGPILAKKLLLAGHNDFGETILRVVERTQTKPTSDTLMAQAVLEEHEELFQEATETLETVINQNDESTPRAVIRLIETSAAQSLGLPDTTALLAETLAKEYQDDALGPDLRRSVVLAYSLLGQFETAEQALSEIAMRDDPELHETTENQFMNALVDGASDAVFARLAWDRMASEPNISFKLAQRFLDLGFADQADYHFPKGADMNDENAVLSAKIAIGQGKLETALNTLAQVQTEEAQQLKADALMRLGKPKDAAVQFVQAAKDDLAQRASWLAEDWQVLAKGESELSETARILANQNANPLSQDAAITLEQGETALSRSTDLRKALETVLSP